MLKTILSGMFCLIVTTNLLAQNRAEKELIKSSGEFYWGEAVSNSSKEASDLALSYLTQSIAVQVSSTFQSSTQETISNQKSDFKEVSENILQTYSTATLKNVQTMRMPVDGKIEVFHYIKKTEVAKIYNERKQLVFNIYEQALKFEDDKNYGYALKWYYFGIILMNSIPEQNIMYQNENLNTKLSSSINKILRKTRFTLIKEKQRSEKELELIFKVTVDDKPVQHLEFSFFDGFDLVNSQATDGSGIVYLVGTSMSLENLSLAVRYSYYEARNEINEVGQLWDLVTKPSFKNSMVININDQREELNSRLNSNSSMPMAGGVDQSGTTESLDEIKLESDAEIPAEITNKITSSIDEIVKLSSSGKVSDLISKYQSDVFLSSKLTALFKLNGTTILDEPLTGTINKTYDGFEFRRATAVNKYGSLSKQSKEYLVFDFNDAGVLTDVNFGVIDDLYKKFVTQAQYGNDWNNREVIIKFMERYRTAYMTRNLDMLANMFAEEAVIIVGRVLKKGEQKKNYDYVPIGDDQPDVEYLRFTKEEYLRRQKKVFDAQRDIYLGFSNFNIMRKINQEGVYGISLRQHYTATNYADEGYLFLLVDFNEEQPQIYVRSWQPQEWGDQTLVKLANFNINK